MCAAMTDVSFVSPTFFLFSVSLLFNTASAAFGGFSISFIGSGFRSRANASARIDNNPESKKLKKKIMVQRRERALSSCFSFQELVELSVADHAYLHFRALLDVVFSEL